ncbi:MAG: (5-formylfuran-3-yl)methyl phosphate synthase [Candidatus Hodarchaeales archaeon]|jgi:uncharacterized protein (UPF0264 family)
MKLLVSPIDVEESRICLEGGADIIDVKNPREGSLGASFPAMIKAIREEIGAHPLSAALGDVMFKPGTIAFAAYGLASLGVDYIKIGLLDFKTPAEASEVLLRAKQSIEMVSAEINLVAAGYADFNRVGSLSPLEVLDAASKSGCDVAMLDTAIKDGRGLFFWLEKSALHQFVEECHRRGMKAALAGSIIENEIPAIRELGADIVGIRGAACSGNDRNHGQISLKRVQLLQKRVMGE